MDGILRGVLICGRCSEYSARIEIYLFTELPSRKHLVAQLYPLKTELTTRYNDSSDFKRPTKESTMEDEKNLGEGSLEEDELHTITITMTTAKKERKKLTTLTKLKSRCT